MKNLYGHCNNNKNKALNKKFIIRYCSVATGLVMIGKVIFLYFIYKVICNLSHLCGIIDITYTISGLKKRK